MFCFQCQETAKNTGCVSVGVCGKSEDLSSLFDDLIFDIIELAAANNYLRQKNAGDLAASRLITDGLFSTITNANFDQDAVCEKLYAVRKKLSELSEMANKADSDDFPSFNCSANVTRERVCILWEKDEDIRSLKQLIIYGVKGAAAYCEHARALGFEQESIYAQIEDALCKTREEVSVEELLGTVLQVGQTGVKAMALLDKANTSSFGYPEMTFVELSAGERPGILISGHDLSDLKELLEQSEGKGIDIYTHSEMLPAHYYPYFKKFRHFKGNYGNAWWKQQEEFAKFNGPILFTSNCIVPPKAESSYRKRIFTTGSCGLEGATHITKDPVSGKKDFSQIIAAAQKCNPPEQLEKGKLVGGFAHHQMSILTDRIVNAVKKGVIKRFVVMAGCDGRHTSRQYYSDFAQEIDKSCLILTAGCAKYRYNKLALTPNGEFPRVLDAGQCNDCYSLIVIADELRKALGLKTINDLPITFNIAWYEQKAVVVLLALLSLGVKNIHLGPTLPAFLSKNVLSVLKDKFNIGTITTAKQDAINFMR